jgi:hypothetical protein
MSRVQNAGRSHNIKVVNKSFEMAKQLRYLGTNLTNQNCVSLKINHQRVSRCTLQNSVQNLTLILLFKVINIKIHVYRTIILPVVLYGCETWSLTLREEHRMRVFENRALRTIFWPKRDKLTGSGENYIMRSLMICIPHKILLG